MPTLYLVATPIGNLEDITLRAIRVLKEVGVVAAEDTRKTRILFSRYHISTALVSYQEHSPEATRLRLIDKLKEIDVALVSEAGMPGISDPGYKLICAAIDQGIPVVPIPGPSIVLTALAVSGLPTDRFLYVGFLPRRQSERRKLLESLASERSTIVAFESPHRIPATLSDLLTSLGDRRIAVCREMTKLHEEVFRGTISAAIERFKEPRGEFTLVVEGAPEKSPAKAEDVAERLAQLRKQGIRAKEAVDLVAAETGLPRRQVYTEWLKTKG